METNLKMKPEELFQTRSLTHLHLLANPNHFGTISDKGLVEQFPAVINLGNFRNNYEALECIDYKPDTRSLGAIVQIKQAGGYGGSPCVGGSREYIRFFVDYENDGTWVDEGLAQFGIYDHATSNDLCYYAQITLDVNKTSCCQSKPVVPKVRAILSWNNIPTANDPNFQPIWGDVSESSIQIAPSNSIWCYILNGLDKVPNLELPKAFLQNNFEKKFLPELKDNVKFAKNLSALSMSPVALKEIYGKEVSESRIAFKSVSMALQNSNKVNYASLTKTLPGFNLSEILTTFQQQEFNTDFEELKCVSLNRDANTLHAAVQLKRSNGFSGNLCTKGSQEYVAFYMDFGSGWEYMGTNSVAVHDIPETPAGGLWYDVSLGINLDAHRKAWCQVGEAKVKGILSWNTPPTPNDPNYKATWGDWEECNVEVKPFPKGVVPGDVFPFMEKVGGMVVTDINQVSGLATTTSGSASLGGAFESPFYGEIQVIGRIFNAAPGTKYRFLVTTPSSPEHPLLESQSIQTVTNPNVISAPISVPTDADGWLDYYATNSNVAILGDLIGRYYPTEEGMFTIKIEMKDAANVVKTGNSTHFFVDLKAPVVSIHIVTGGGDCADFKTGDMISGTYSMADAHAGAFSISVTPNKGALVGVDGNVPVAITDGLSYPGGGLPATGKSGTFTITTAGVPKCGYNVRIDASDRTIVSSQYVGLHSPDIQGFCLRNE